jgi:hypothetical protein
MTTNWTCFFFSFCIAPHSQVGQLMFRLFFMQFLKKNSQRKLDPITTLDVATTHFLTPIVQQGNQVLTKLPSPPLSPLFKSSTSPYASSHPLHTQV